MTSTYTYTLNNTTYVWETAHTPHMLYGYAILSKSTVPDGMVLTLRDMHETPLLTLRGEMHGEAIAFFHITDGSEIGAWVPMEMDEMEQIAVFE